jgi:hypothetical protein
MILKITKIRGAQKKHTVSMKLQVHERREEKIMTELKICSRLPGFWT